MSEVTPPGLPHPKRKQETIDVRRAVRTGNSAVISTRSWRGNLDSKKLLFKLVYLIRFTDCFETIIAAMFDIQGLAPKKVTTLHQLQETPIPKICRQKHTFFDEDDELEDLLPNVEHPSLVSENTISKYEYSNENTLPPLLHRKYRNVERTHDSSTTGHRIIDVMPFSKQIIKLDEHS
uniref:Uncharacterized protein n=1 Tax=Timema monikensis TaxID=170555 RepID=A0A7R9EKQ5_9NEOP|nr:unnamed protein product [Timema monikensis]